MNMNQIICCGASPRDLPWNVGPTYSGKEGKYMSWNPLLQLEDRFSGLIGWGRAQSEAVFSWSGNNMVELEKALVEQRVRVLPTCVSDYLLQKPELVPDSWKRKRVMFFGSVWSDPWTGEEVGHYVDRRVLSLTYRPPANPHRDRLGPQEGGWEQELIQLNHVDPPVLKHEDWDIIVPYALESDSLFLPTSCVECLTRVQLWRL